MRLLTICDVFSLFKISKSFFEMNVFDEARSLPTWKPLQLAFLAFKAPAKMLVHLLHQRPQRKAETIKMKLNPRTPKGMHLEVFCYIKPTTKHGTGGFGLLLLRSPLLVALNLTGSDHHQAQGLKGLWSRSCKDLLRMGWFFKVCLAGMISFPEVLRGVRLIGSTDCWLVAPCSRGTGADILMDCLKSSCRCLSVHTFRLYFHSAN